MNIAENQKNGVLLLIAGIKGAIGTTLAGAVRTMREQPDRILPYLTTADKFPYLGDPLMMDAAGWDIRPESLSDAIAAQGVLEKGLWESCSEAIDRFPVQPAPDPKDDLRRQVDQVRTDIEEFKAASPGTIPVMVNLLPAGCAHELARFSTLADLYEHAGDVIVPDLAYVLAAIEAGVPVVNFTPNEIEMPAIITEAETRGVPIAGRDGKSGQTYFKVVLASALRARRLFVNGWYSLNILGNADGENLMNPEHAACKLTNKTGVLENVLGYSPGMRAYGKPTHKVHIEYYPPRGDAKEAWDVIDFEGVFGLPMSMRLNLQGRDSILAAPMVLDLARWMAALALAGRSGAVSELAFFFKKGIGENVPVTYEEQLAALDVLERECDSRVGEREGSG